MASGPCTVLSLVTGQLLTVNEGSHCLRVIGFHQLIEGAMLQAAIIPTSWSFMEHALKKIHAMYAVRFLGQPCCCMLWQACWHPATFAGAPSLSTASINALPVNMYQKARGLCPSNCMRWECPTQAAFEAGETRSGHGAHGLQPLPRTSNSRSRASTSAGMVQSWPVYSTSDR